MTARIVKVYSKDFTVLLENGERVVASLRGKVKRNERPVTGDLVEVNEDNGSYAVAKVLPRKNFLIRPPVANVDQALIVMSVKDPDFSPALVDRLTVLIEEAGIEPLLCVTKCDLGIDPEIEERIREYERGPLKVIRTAKSALDPSLADILADKITVLTGQSGAGKSTLLNELNPDFHLETQEISKALGRGRHTTRHSELHDVAGGLVADTPGFSSLDFSKMDEKILGQYVPDFEPYIGRCRFNDCIHQNEPGCAVKEAVELGDIPKVRYQNYLQILKLIQERKGRL